MITIKKTLLSPEKGGLHNPDKAILLTLKSLYASKHFKYHQQNKKYNYIIL